MPDKHLQNLNEQLEKGVVPAPESVRTILTWFGVGRRGYNVVREIREAFVKFNLATIPDFEFAYIDEPLNFTRPGQYKETSPHTADPIFRIGQLEAANRKPVAVKPTATLEQATTLMLASGFSQLPVMTTEREVKGMVSWKSIGSRLALGKTGPQVNSFMEDAKTVLAETSLFEAIRIVSECEYVLVQGPDKTIRGIVTATDLSNQFRNLAEPFLLIGEIENHIRKLIHGKYSVEDLRVARDGADAARDVNSISDLTFGEYIRLIENEERWKKLNLQVDRVEFVTRLSQVRTIRNDVMHFDPDGLMNEELSTLQNFATFLRSLRSFGAI